MLFYPLFYKCSHYKKMWCIDTTFNVYIILKNVTKLILGVLRLGTVLLKSVPNQFFVLFYIFNCNLI